MKNMLSPLLLKAPLNQPNRRSFLFGAATAAFAVTSPSAFARTFAPLPAGADDTQKGSPLIIKAVELIELHGRYTDEAGVNRQQQVNPLDVYDQFRPPEYKDKPAGSKEVHTSAIYVRIQTAAGIDGHS